MRGARRALAGRAAASGRARSRGAGRAARAARRAQCGRRADRPHASRRSPRPTGSRGPRRASRPQPIGRFWVHGSHVDEPPPAGALPILLDAGHAFGSGEHATTQGCLLALERLARRRRLPARARPRLRLRASSRSPRPSSGAARVLAADNDPVAVAVARANAARNGVAHRVRDAGERGLRATRGCAPPAPTT